MMDVKSWRRVAILLCGALLSLPAYRMRAQQVPPPTRTTGVAQSGQVFPPDPAETGGQDIPALAARVEALARRVEELSRLVEILSERTAMGSDSEEAASVKPPQGSQSAGAAAPAPLPESPRSSKQDNAASTAGMSPAGQPAIEPAPATLGLLRFSGDFRLRLDGIIRPSFHSEDPDQASLSHVQNVRARYRFRFNLDCDLHPSVSFHGQLSTGAANNPLTLDQDFTATITRHPFFINEAWIDFHPGKGISFQGGKVQEVFADNLRFLFDDDITFNGFNERAAHEFSRGFAGFRRIEFRAGQYIFTNPNVAVVTQGNLGPSGAVLGSTGRAAQMFHQGLILEQSLGPSATQSFGADIQLYRNPNQIQLASTAAGLPILVQNGLGIALSGPLPGTGNATTTSGGAIYSAHGFQVARLTYRLDYSGFTAARRAYPITFNFQAARNVGTARQERDALMANIKIGKVKNRWDLCFLYLFARKGANSMISQLTDDDLGTSTGVNIRAHYLRFDIGLARGIQLQNLFFIQNELSSSGRFADFFVPLGAFTPRQYRFQEQILFVF